MANQIHEIGRIFAIVNCERDIEPNFACIFTQEPRTNSVKSPGPCQRSCDLPTMGAQCVGSNTLNSTLHLRGCAPRESQQHYPACIGTRRDQMRYAVRQSVGFPGACTRNDEQGSVSVVLNCVLLLSITEVLLTLICAIPLAATSSPANKMKKVRFSTKIASIETSVNDDNTRKCSPSHGKRPTRIKNLTLWLSTKL